MRVRILSPTGDYTFGQSALNFYKDIPAAVAQVIGTSLRLFVGEWYLDVSLGTPWFEGVLGKYTQDQADATIKTAILGVQGVENIVTFSSSVDPVTRTYSITKCVVNTIYGPTEIQMQNYRNF